MSVAVILDTGPLSLIAGSGRTSKQESRECNNWLQSLLAQSIKVYIPEVCDYEARRSFIRIKSRNSLTRLDNIQGILNYLSITTNAMREAAQFWADARNAGIPAASDNALDGDMVLIGQAAEVVPLVDRVIIATTNVKHIERYHEAMLWQNIDAATL